MCIKFCAKFSKSEIETLEMFCVAFGDEALNQTTILKWHSRFKSGRHSFEDGKPSGRISTSKTVKNVEQIGKLIREDRRLTTQQLADKVEIGYGVCQEIDKLNMRRIAPKFVPRLQKNDP